MKRILALSWLVAMLLPAAYGQSQPPGYVRDLCVKAHPGKLSGLRAFMLDPVAKASKYRVDGGTYSWVVIAEAVAPAGREARCDFRIVYGSAGFPAEQNLMTTEDLKKAGIGMTVEQRNAKRDELSYLVATDYWVARDLVGTSVKGGYVRINYYKTKPGMAAEWTRAEQTGWKQLAEAFAKDKPGTGWGVYTLAMPGGAEMPYNAMTVDMLPNWAALGAPGRQRATWNKIHPETDYSAYMDRVGNMASRVRVDTMRLIEVIRKP